MITAIGFVLFVVGVLLYGASKYMEDETVVNEKIIAWTAVIGVILIVCGIVNLLIALTIIALRYAP